MYLFNFLGMISDCWVISLQTYAGKLSNRQSGMSIHTELVMIMELE
jgi:hypothetical protein